MPTEGDVLLQMIHDAVRERGVPPRQQQLVAELVAYTVHSVLTNPNFLERLAPVMHLRGENQMLREQLALTATMLNRLTAKNVARKRPAKKASAAKRPVAKSPKVQVKGSTTANRKAFKEGFRDVRR